MATYRIAYYIRLSHEDSKTDSMSIPNQRLLIRKKAESLPEWPYAETQEFVDNGYSGTNFERPAMQEMLSLIQEGRIDCVIVKDFSRFGRNSLETGYFLERVFPMYHTRFISIGDGYDSLEHPGDTGGMDAAFRYLINEAYSRDLSVKNRSAKYARMRRGEYQSTICPYGYRKSADGRMEPNEETAPVIQKIFQMAAEGMACAAIARKLTDMKIPTPGEYRAAHTAMKYRADRIGGIWASGTVREILSDERYTGVYIMGKRVVREVGSGKIRWRDENEWFKLPDHHPAIVEKELFQAAQEKRRHIPHPREQRHVYPLRGKVFCGYCGHALSRYNEGERTKYYCRHSAGHPDRPCYELRLRATDLEQAVLETLKAHMSVIAGTNYAADALNDIVLEAAEHENRKQEVMEAKRRLYEQYVEGGISLACFQEKNTELDNEMLRVRNILAALHEKAKERQEKQEANRRREEMLLAVKEADSLSPVLAEKLIRRVTVFHGGRMEIDYAVQDCLGMEAEKKAEGSQENRVF